MPQAGFEPETAARDRQQTLALHLSAIRSAGFDPRPVHPVASRYVTTELSRPTKYINVKIVILATVLQNMNLCSFLLEMINK
jgi:hypothetical protein